MLQVVGLQRVSLQNQNPVDLTQVKPPSLLRIVIRLHAGELLNTDANGKSLPVVAKIYEMKDKVAFMQVSGAVFEGDRKNLPSALAEDVLAVREVVLTPGRPYEITETVPEGTRYLGVVALFRAPAEGRWRHVFEARAAADSGLTLGVHACALSVASGQALDVAPELTRLAGVRCA